MAAFGTAGQQEKAQQLMLDGEKCLKKWTLFSSTTKNDDAAECFRGAGNCFKVARMWDEAAEAYGKAAEQFELAKSNHEASSAHIEAAKCHKSSDKSTLAIESYTKAINIYNEAGRFQQAGKMLKEVGEIHEKNREFPAAVDALQQAAEFLQSENSTASANACFVKIATMISQDMNPPDLGRAAEIFERLGKSCMEKKLLQMNAKGYWLQAGLCHLAQGDTVGARNKQSEFMSEDYNFEDSREWRFLDQLIKANEDLDMESFSTHCYEYDQISKLDAWKTKMLLKIKRTIEAGAGVEEDEDEEVDLT